MSTQSDLIARARVADPQLAADLEKHLREQSKRRTFGLVYEQHLPEAVELPGVKPRRGSKVHLLLPRDATDADRKKGADKTLWTIDRFHGTGTARTADLTETHSAPDAEPRTTTAPVADLVVVSEFEDTIYPGLVETGRVQNAPDGTPEHVVINAENYHALEMLTYTHRHAVDAIYIDPPYNTGAKDWKYNNDYVEADDDYRHSKWLSFMERRLRIAKDLLNPADSVLIVTIDEKEYLRLGLLLEQTFPEASVTMVSSNINPGGSTRRGTFARAVEYIYFVQQGASVVRALPLGADWDAVQHSTKHSIHWHPLQRTGQSRGNTRVGRPKLFYPIFVQQFEGNAVFHSVGSPVEGEASDVVPPEGCVAVLPIRKDGTEGCWGVGPESLRALIGKGYARLGKWNAARTPIYFLQEGMVRKVEAGDFKIIGDRADGSVVTDDSSYQARFIPEDMWRIAAHDASRHGSNLLRSLMPDRKFPFPKSLYAVRDTIRFFVDDKPNAVVLDFFSGSATTAHAVMLLNRLDGGRRRCVSVTNNEVSVDEQTGLRKRGLRPGDSEWEALGICDYITKPRIKAAITGRTPAGDPIKGDYRFMDEFPMSEGFEANARFFTLTYETPESIRYNDSFSRIGPMLWMRAGQAGECITDLGSDGWAIADNYAVIENIGNSDRFLAALDVNGAESMRIVYVITNDSGSFQQIAQAMPESVEMVQLYESYLSNFEISTGRKG